MAALARADLAEAPGRARPRTIWSGLTCLAPAPGGAKALAISHALVAIKSAEAPRRARRRALRIRAGAKATPRALAAHGVPLLAEDMVAVLPKKAVAARCLAALGSELRCRARRALGRTGPWAVLAARAEVATSRGLDLLLQVAAGRACSAALPGVGPLCAFPPVVHGSLLRQRILPRRARPATRSAARPSGV